MMRVEIVTVEGRLYLGEADRVLAPGLAGQLGILPHHTYLIAALGDGVLIVRHGGVEEAFIVHGGLLQVRPDRVVVLADVAEAAAAMDAQRASGHHLEGGGEGP